MKIIQNFTPVNFTPGRKGIYPPDTIVIHVTEGSFASARAWFRDPAAQVSAHYGVSRKGEIEQWVDEANTAWCNGRVNMPTAAIVKERLKSNPNNWTVSIENEGTGKEELTDLQRNSLLFLTKDIATRRKIPLTRRHIIRHQEIYSLKTCPGVISVDRLVRELNCP